MFDYLDARAFLRDAYLYRKEKHGTSYRALARRLGVTSPNYLKRVIDGDRNLSSEMSERVAKLLKLNAEASAYFVDLVQFTQAKTSTQKNAYYSKLTGFHRYRKGRRLELAHAAYHSTWYLPAIRELASRRDFVTEPAWIAAELVPPISRADAAAALDTLLELGLLVQDAKGVVRLGEPVVSTGPEIRGLHIVNYHRSMLERASEAIDTVASADRDISSLTLCLGENGLRRLKERIQRFRRELIELATLEDDPLQVVQVNFQLFPLSKGERRDADEC